MLISNGGTIESLPEDIKTSLNWVADTSIGQIYFVETNILGL